jgi:transcriptional regulator with XRE-family HTH domain
MLAFMVRTRGKREGADGRKLLADAAKLGRHLQDLRVARKLSQADVAAAAGLQQTDISKIESGKRWPSVPQLAAICAALGVRTSAVLNHQQSTQGS